MNGHFIDDPLTGRVQVTGKVHPQSWAKTKILATFHYIGRLPHVSRKRTFFFEDVR
ncbi:hypothetical protein G9A89_009889 [Geosiphon pyriformis]|nr:hypothetical protein G9A89_009889 [Geosiphon pyriformis]